MNNRILPYHITSTFALEYRLDSQMMNRLWEYISIARANEEELDYSKNLAGNISTELILKDLVGKDNIFFHQVVLPLIEDWKMNFGTLHHYRSNLQILTKNADYTMDSPWVNIQYQHEFNPLHNHTGLFSFVVFMKIPYDWREQHVLPHVKGRLPVAGDLVFYNLNALGHITPFKYPLDPTSEGIMLFFPAEIFHAVYPFYECEEERITISGNIVYDN